MADVYQCTKTYNWEVDARRHARIVHIARREPAKQRCPCPLADEYQCFAKFWTLDAAKRHAERLHTKLHRSPAVKRFLCPLAEAYQCTKTYTTRTNAQRHAKTSHINRRERCKKRYPCPLADKYQCFAKFWTPDGAKRHAECRHSLAVGVFPCPLAEAYQCTKTYFSKEAAKLHSKRHLPSQFPCPFAEQYQCSKAFDSKQDALLHAKQHPNLPCPLAKEYDCTAVFSCKANATRHSESAHLLPFKCYMHCCPERYPTPDLLVQHVQDTNAHRKEDFFLCPVATCFRAIRQEPLSRATGEGHLYSHKRKGEMTGAEILQPFKPSQTSRCDLYNLIIQDSYLQLNQIEKNEDSKVTSNAIVPRLPDWQGEDISDKEDGESDRVSHYKNKDEHIDLEGDEDEDEDEDERDDQINLITADIITALKKIPQHAEADRSRYGSILLATENRPWILAQNTKYWRMWPILPLSRPVHCLANWFSTPPANAYHKSLFCRSQMFRTGGCPKVFLSASSFLYAMSV